jgi:hypothetical protein
MGKIQLENLRCGLVAAVGELVFSLALTGCNSEPPPPKSSEAIEKARVEHGKQVLQEAQGKK